MKISIRTRWRLRSGISMSIGGLREGIVEREGK